MLVIVLGVCVRVTSPGPVNHGSASNRDPARLTHRCHVSARSELGSTERQRLTSVGTPPPPPPLPATFFLSCAGHHALHDAAKLKFAFSMRQRLEQAAQALTASAAKNTFTWEMARIACLKAVAVYKKACKALEKDA